MKRLSIILLFLVGVSFAQLSPGKLTEAHKHLKGLKNCTQCHSRTDQIASQKCLQCHKILKNRIDQKKGMHAHADYGQCEKCHVEHQGRDYKLVYWPESMDNFDHSLTGYDLVGKHKEQKCRDCHKKSHIPDPVPLEAKNKNFEKTFLGLSQDCISCHHDEHRGQMKQDCLECHTMDGWTPAPKFDHSKTKFTLVGKHKTTSCDKCHPSTTDHAFADDDSYLKFGGVSFANCTDCHKDIHENKFGRQCEKCHTPSAWRPAKSGGFNHDLTSFPLKNKHQKVDCQKCHLPGRSIKIAKYKMCSDCHANAHAGQMELAIALKCETCHTTEGFSPSIFTIAQHEKTKFPLKGSHLAVPCFACHKRLPTRTAEKNIQFTFSSTRCSSCHKDPHQRQVDDFIKKGGCESCHSVENWRQTTFDHNTTKFPLKGRHERITCASCHTEKADAKKYIFQNMSRDCQTCHKDIHYGQFALNKERKIKPFTNCSRCHTPTDWLAEKFVHNRDSRFKLDGAHEKVACESCHKNVTVRGITVRHYRPLKRKCKDCHGSKKK